MGISRVQLGTNGWWAIRADIVVPGNFTNELQSAGAQQWTSLPQAAQLAS